LGYQSKSSSKAFSKRLIYSYKHLIPYSWRKKLKKKKAIKSNFKRVIDFKPSRSAAFCKSELGEVSGVFINDEKRFNGPIAFEDIDSKVIEICNSINGSEEAKKYSLTAFPSKEHFQNETYQNLVPD